MRYLMCMLTITALGCVYQPDYKEPAGHPAAAEQAVRHAPGAADPFAITAPPIESATEPQPHAGHDKTHNQQPGEMLDMPDEHDEHDEHDKHDGKQNKPSESIKTPHNDHERGK